MVVFGMTVVEVRVTIVVVSEVVIVLVGICVDDLSAAPSAQYLYSR